MNEAFQATGTFLCRIVKEDASYSAHASPLHSPAVLCLGAAQA